MRVPSLICVPILVAMFTCTCWGQNQRQEFEKAKTATALLVIAERKFSASAAGVNAQEELFTNQHLLKDVNRSDALTLILNDEARTEIAARILREDSGSDLAVLKAADLKGQKLVPIDLGDDRELFETTSITAFGFPFGKALAVNDQKHPD